MKRCSSRPGFSTFCWGLSSAPLGETEGDAVDVGSGVIFRGGVLIIAGGGNDSIGEGDDVAAGVTFGVGVTAGLADGGAVSITLAGADCSGVDVGLADGVSIGEVADAEGVSVLRARSGVDVGVALGSLVGEGVAEAAGVSGRCARTGGVEVAVVVASGEGEALSVGAAEAAAAVGCAAAISGFTNVLEGASAGGVDSDFILVRACSAACRSPMSSQPCSIMVCAIAAFAVRGRSAGRPIAITGAGIASTSPRTTGRPTSTLRSTLTSLSKRKRSIGCWLRVRSSP